MDSTELIARRSIAEWDRMWQSAGLLTDNFSVFARSVGLYRASLDGQVVYIGRAIEFSNGGLRKRLSDYTRKSPSAREYGSGRKMAANAAALKIDILSTGGDAIAAEVARQLKGHMIQKYRPSWNKQGSS